MLSRSERPYSIFAEYPADWPPQEFYVNQGTVTQGQYDKLQSLINNGASETDVEDFFNENPAALAQVLTLFRTDITHRGLFPNIQFAHI